MTRLLSLMALVGLAVFGDVAQGTTFEYIEQTRSVSAFSFIDFSEQSYSASDFAPFSASASVYGASASHASTLGPTEMEFRLDAGGGDAANSSSRFIVQFSLSQTMPYTLTGFAFSSGGISPTVTLKEVGGAVIYSSVGYTIDAAGILPAGIYELSSIAAYGGFTPTEAVGALLVIPEPAAGSLVVLGLLGLGIARRRER